MSQKRENLRISTWLTLLITYSIYLVNRQERSSLIKSSFSVFWQKGNFILPFAVNVMLKVNISTVMWIQFSQIGIAAKIKGFINIIISSGSIIITSLESE